MDDRDQHELGNLDPATEQSAFESVGAKLQSARVAAGLSLNEIANRTRVPIRHLEAIEAADYAALPGSTYTIGFTRSYAKSLGLDDTAIIEEMREELAQGGYQGTVARAPAYEPADPARVPPRWLAWSAAALAVGLVAAYFIWRSYALSPVEDSEAPKSVVEAPIKDNADQTKSATQIDPAGEVILTARESVWIKIYDADNKRLYENEMKPGDRYTVPSDANNPMIVTGRPQVLDVTVGGKPVPALGSGERSIADVGVSAPALLARKIEATPATEDAAKPTPSNPAQTPPSR